MNLQSHLITSLILSLILLPFFGISAFLVLIGGFLIDSDHYLYYIFKKKDFSLKKAYIFFENKTHHNVFCIFHTFEFIIILFFAGFFSKFIALISVGAIVHFMMDLYFIQQNRDLRKEIGMLSLISRFVVKR